MRKNRKDKKSFYAFFLSIFLCLWIFFRIWYDGITYSSINFILILTVFFFTVLTCLINRKEEKTLPLPFLFLFLFILFSFISSGISEIKGTGILYNINILSFFCFLILIMEIPVENIKYLLFTLLFATLILGVYGIYQYFWGFEITRNYVFSHPNILKNLPPTFLERLQSNRIFSRFIYSNIYASFLLAVLPLAYFTTFKKNLYLKTLAWTAFFIAFYNLLLTGSVGGLFIFVFIFHVIFFFVILPKEKVLKIIFPLVILEIFIVILGYKTGKLPHIHSFIDRIGYWKASLSIFKEKPIFGIGPENFQFYYLKYKLPRNMEAKHAHSLFFETLAENGIIGIILLFSFLISVPFFSLKFKEKQDFITWGIIFGYMAFFMHNLIDFEFIDPSAGFLFFLFAGMLFLTIGSYREIKLTFFRPFLIIIIMCSLVAGIRYNCCLKNLTTAKNIDNTKIKLFFLNRAEKFFPHYLVYYEKGNIYIQMGIKEQKEQYLKEGEKFLLYSIQLNPYFAKGYRSLAFYYQTTGRLKECEKMFSKLLEIYPTKKQFYLEVSLFYKSIKNEEKFRYYYDKSKELYPVSIEEKNMCEEYEKWIELQK